MGELKDDHERCLVLVKRRAFLLPGRTGNRDSSHGDKQWQRMDRLNAAPRCIANYQMFEQQWVDDVAPASADTVASKPECGQQDSRDEQP
jgi:hypothetical protein